MYFVASGIEGECVWAAILLALVGPPLALLGISGLIDPRLIWFQAINQELDYVPLGCKLLGVALGFLGIAVSVAWFSFQWHQHGLP